MVLGSLVLRAVTLLWLIIRRMQHSRQWVIIHLDEIKIVLFINKVMRESKTLVWNRIFAAAPSFFSLVSDALALGEELFMSHASTEPSFLSDYFPILWRNQTNQQRWPEVTTSTLGGDYMRTSLEVTTFKAAGYTKWCWINESITMDGNDWIMNSFILEEKCHLHSESRKWRKQ